MPHLSVIIPAYNEEKRLPTTLESVHAFLSETGQDFEIIVVDDGSSDNTKAVVNDFAGTHCSVRLIAHTPNMGKGYSVREGMLKAQGEYLLLDDADGASPIAEVVRLLSAIEAGADVAIGSRAKPGDETVVKALSHRKHIGNTFNLIVQSSLLPGIQDTQCGFKLFKRDVAMDLFSIARLNRYAFDVEILYLARMKGYEIAEVPINWTNVEGSKINLVTDPMNMLFEIGKVILGRMFGSYGKLSKSKQRPSDG
ncbi:MAG: glycosyltransferase family 2 protein [Candidatus Melainabacteria bacterium]|nr:MAG: glycosyltransferase family 2 protein [Candidatus Melainabacteria bacterium]